jgi:hypothetical protein
MLRQEKLDVPSRPMLFNVINQGKKIVKEKILIT